MSFRYLKQELDQEISMKLDISTRRFKILLYKIIIEGISNCKHYKNLIREKKEVL